MKHYCKNTVAMNFLALFFLFFLILVCENGNMARKQTLLCKDDESNRSNSSHKLSTTHFDDMNIGPTDHCDCNKWATWRRDGHSDLDFRIINLLRRPVLLTQILSSDLPWLWPHCPSLSQFFTMLPTGLLSMSWISYASPSWPSRPEESASLAMLPASIHPTPLPTLWFLEAASSSLPALERCLYPSQAKACYSSTHPAVCPLFNFSHGILITYLFILFPLLLLHSTPNSDVSSMGIGCSVSASAWHVLRIQWIFFE